MKLSDNFSTLVPLVNLLDQMVRGIETLKSEDGKISKNDAIMVISNKFLVEIEKQVGDVVYNFKISK